MHACPAPLVRFAERLADLARPMLTRAIEDLDGVEIEIKPDGSPVTSIDKTVEAALRAAITEAHPDHGVIGEEFPPTRPEAEFVWIIDPLDGTREFLHGLPLFGLLLALEWRGRFVLGVADAVATGDRWVGADGHGTRRNGRPVRVRARESLDRASVSTMGYDTFCKAHHDRLLPLRDGALARVTADSFYVFGLLAQGRVDLIASAGFAPHDYAALEPIVRNAGGVMTDWAGRPLDRSSDGTILAAGCAPLADAARAILAR